MDLTVCSQPLTFDGTALTKKRCGSDEQSRVYLFQKSGHDEDDQKLDKLKSLMPAGLLYVGHTVKIIGVVSNANAHGMKEDAKEEMKVQGMDKHSTERGHMTVTDLTMVSDTCQK